MTFLIATPTFLQGYMRRCKPESFGSLQYVLVGAEKLPERVALAFEDQFGIRPLEGYGCTECSPVVAVNGKDFRGRGFRQVAAKRGKIGHPLPGVTVKIVDIDSGQPVTPGTSGMLVVKGPNVMRGYLGKPEKTAEVLHDGWYTTGDIATIDDDGFLTITDRLSRFSKIGGEMVPHIRIEDKLHELAETTEQVFAVTALPDQKKGERIIALYTLPDAKLAEVLERFAACDLPALWKPKANQFVHVDAISRSWEQGKRWTCVALALPLQLSLTWRELREHTRFDVEQRGCGEVARDLHRAYALPQLNPVAYEVGMDFAPYLVIAAVVVFGPWVLVLATRRRTRREREEISAHVGSVPATRRVY